MEAGNTVEQVRFGEVKGKGGRRSGNSTGEI